MTLFLPHINWAWPVVPYKLNIATVPYIPGDTTAPYKVVIATAFHPLGVATAPYKTSHCPYGATPYKLDIHHGLL